MRIAFLVAVLAGAVFYTYVAFADLGFMTRTGRLGPGFFPRIIGLAMVAIAIWIIADHLRGRDRGAATPGRWSDVASLTGLALGYAVLLWLLGGFLASVVFLLAALSMLNPGRPLQNGALALVLPLAVYLLFDVLLNASMPPGLVPFPI
ncbi:tripartite tricarboxylate transporter TctB family protein [Salinarimonas rosea]|uniref:tripartite tricarboxylate transporter TctB family protein n=1 Tax=Salinarimonas rosea TaxID=552063 RepID=UPI0004093903|nr:tripartite tricarboxylate transporter TctB family protein [Salinarimonas rosea]